MFSLDGEIAIVTGASRGLGAETARQLADLGAAVGVNYPVEEERAAATSVCDGIEADGGTAIPVSGDVSAQAAVAAMFDAAADAIGTPTVLVNNAGVGAAAPITDVSVEEWKRVQAVDLRGVFLCAREAVRRMSPDPKDPPRIVNITSQLAFAGAPELTHYCAAKGGVVSFTRALAREIAPGILVNAVAPGPMHTDMLHEGTSDAWRETKRSEIPLERFGDPAEVAPSICFLAGDAASYYTGQVLSPDGGDAMH